MIRTTEYRMLRGADIDAITEQIEHFLTEQQVSWEDTLRLRLTMEELLLRVRDQRGRDTPCALTLGRRFGRAYVQLSYVGEAYDPTSVYRESEGEAWSAQLLANLGAVPSWSWKRGVNRLLLHPPRSGHSSFLLLGIAVAAALALGFLGNLLPEAWREAAVTLALSPLFGAYLGAMGTFVGLMIFFSVVCGICGIGDTSAFERMGKVVLGRFIGLTTLWSALGCVAASLCFSLNYGGAGQGGSRFVQILELLYSIVPRDPVSPFLNGDFKQIIFLSAVVGVILLALGGQAERVRELAEQCNLLVLAIMERICRLVPLFVFITLLRQIWTGSFDSLLRAWKPLAVFVVGGLLIVAIKLLLTGFKLKVSVKKLFRVLWPTFLVALSTSSSAAVFGRTMDSCEKELGVSHKLVLIGLPIGNILCMPVATLCFSSVLLYLAESYAVAVSAGWLVMLILIDAILCMAMPPIPGAFLTCFSIMLAQLGIPMDGLAVMAALNVFLDAACTAYCNAYMHLELAMQAEQLDLLDRKILEA